MKLLVLLFCLLVLIVNLEVSLGAPSPGEREFRHYHSHDSYGGYEDYGDHKNCGRHNGYHRHHGKFNHRGEDLSISDNTNEHDDAHHGYGNFKNDSPNSEESDSISDNSNVTTAPVTSTTTPAPKIDVRSG